MPALEELSLPEIRSSRHPWMTGAVIIVMVAAIAILAWLVIQPMIVLHLTTTAFTTVTNEVVARSRIPRTLVQAILTIALIPFGMAIGSLAKFGVWDWIQSTVRRKPRPVWKSRSAAVIVLAVYTSGYFGLLFAMSRYASFDSQGKALKYWAFTPAGPRVYDEPGFDREFGIELNPMTPEVQDLINRWEQGLRAKRVIPASLDNVAFFDGLGQPALWFAEADGQIQLFDQPGFHPQTRTILRAIDTITVERLRAQMAAAARDGARREQEAAAEAGHARALERERDEASRLQGLLNLGARSPVAVAARLDGRPSRELASRVAEAIGGSPDLFREPFVAGKSFSDALSGDLSIVRRAPAATQTVVLLDAHVRLAQANVGGEAIHKATVEVAGRSVERATGASRTVRWEATGSAFNERDAVDKAIALAATSARAHVR